MSFAGNSPLSGERTAILGFQDLYTNSHISAIILATVVLNAARLIGQGAL